LTVYGSADADTFTLSKAATGVTLQVGPTELAITGTERIDLEAGEGADVITVNDIAAAGVAEVEVDLLQVQTPDTALDRITVNGSALNDGFAISAEGVKITQPNRHAAFIGGVTDVWRSDLLVRVGNVNDHLTVNALAEIDGFTVTGETGPTWLNGGAGADIFSINAKKPSDYIGPLAIDGGTGGNQLTIDESQALIDTVGVLQSTSLIDTVLPKGVTYQATGGTFAGGVTLRTGGGSDTVSVRDILPGIVTTVKTGGGNDAILVSSKDVAGNLAGIKGALSIDAEAGQNALTLTDAGAGAGNAHVVINGTQVLGFAGPSDNAVVDYKATGGTFAGITLGGSNSPGVTELFDLSNPAGPVTIKANAGNDTVRLLGLNQAATIHTGAGNDKVYVGYLFNNLDAIQGPVQVLAGTGADGVYIRDQSAPAGHAYNLSANSLTRNGAGSVGFSADLEHLYVTGTNHANQFAVQGVPAMTNVHLGGGNDTDIMTAPNSPNTFQILHTNSGVLNGRVGFVGIENLTGGTSSDRFAFADGQNVTGGVAGMGGTDMLDYSAYSTAVNVDLQTNTATGVGVFGGIECIRGGTGSDILTGTGNVNLWEITGVNSGQMTNAFLGVEFTQVENLRGGSAADTFALDPAGRLTGTLDGRLGSDTLDYSAWGKGVAVNLSSGTATVVGAVANVENATGGSGKDTLVGNAGNNILRGGGGIDSLKGNLGDDILIGGSGDDLLQGGDGRDILIGGIGVDKLHGGAADDILIGGYTTYDPNDAPLLGLLAEWKTANSYQLRRDHLMFGGGLNGAFLLTPATTIDDGVKDALYGEADIDWFWGQSDATDKSIVNNVPEVVN